MPFDVCAISNTGKIRRNNEDMFLVEHHCSRQAKYCASFDGRDFLLTAVADGMGGHADGEIASQLVLQLLDEHQREGHLPSRPEDHAIFSTILTDIHRQILSEQDCAGGQLPMGATLVGAWFLPERRLIRFHAGDSRLFRWRHDQLSQLTTDHSLATQLPFHGTEGGNVARHLVTSCLGGGESPPLVDTMTLPDSVTDGDRYLLCSDGLTDMLPDDAIAPLMAACTAEQIADSLLAGALEAGGQDNITIIVIRVLSDQAYDRDHR